MVSKSKRVLALILAGLMSAASLAACGTTSTDSGNGSGNGNTNTDQSQSSGDSSGSGSGSGTGTTVDILSDDLKAQVQDMIKAEAKNGKVELKIWCSSSDRKFETYLKNEFVERYKSSGCDIEITVESIEEPDVSSKLQADLSKGADVFSFPDDQIRELADNSCLARVADNLYNNVVQENTDKSVEAVTVNGVPYAFPRTSDNGFFLYYDKRDMTADDIKTFEGIIEKANSKGKSVLFAMNNAWYNAGFFFAAGCTSSYDGTTQKTDFDSDKGLAAAKAMRDICSHVDKGLVKGDDTDVLSGFRNGSLSAAITGTWNGPGIREAIGAENVGAAKLPTVKIDGKDTQLWSFGGYKVVGVRSTTDYPNTAQVLAYYLTCKESQLKRYGGSNAVEKDGKNISRGLIPTNKSALETEDLKNDEAARAIEEQRPFSYPQSTVGGKFWTPQGNFGGFIYDKYADGNTVSDDTLKTELANTVKGFN